VIIVTNLFILVLLLLFSAFFSGSETALFGLSKIQRKKLERNDDLASKSVVSLLETPRKLLITIVIGNVSVNTLSSSFVTAVSLGIFGSYGLGVAVPLMTVLLLIFGELSPKVFAITNSEKFSLAVARPIKWLSKVLVLPIKFLQFITDAMIDFFAPSTSAREKSLTVDEFEMLFKIGVETGEVQQRESELVDDIFEFEETVVREVMTPRGEVDAIKATESVEEAIKQIRLARSARMPLCHDDIDDIYAIVDTKKFLLSGEKSYEAFCDTPFFVPESKRVKAVLQDFREKAIAMAVVLDEYGGVAGIITLEDVLEELFGEVYDEDEPGEQLVETVDKNNFKLLGKAHIDDVAQATGLSLSGEDDEYDTIAGFCMAQIGRLPKQGESFLYEGYTFRILKTAKRTVFEVLMTTGDES